MFSSVRLSPSDGVNYVKTFIILARYRVGRVSLLVVVVVVDGGICDVSECCHERIDTVGWVDGVRIGRRQKGVR